MDSIDFGTLYERYARDIHRFAIYLTGSRTEAEDVTSETFARAWTARDTIRIGTVKAYLFMIARNVCLEGHRARRQVAELDTGTPDGAADPEVVTAGRTKLRAVMQAMAALPEADRAALLMRAEGGLSYEAIAGALGMSVGAVRVRVHRARAKLIGLRAPLKEEQK